MTEEKPEVFICSRCGEEMLNPIRCDHCMAIQSPFADQPDMWLLLPAKWRGEHAQRYESARDKAQELGWVLSTFAGAMAILEDWNISGLNGNPENWDFTQVDLATIGWINFHAVTNAKYGYLSCFEVSKNFSAPSLSGRAAQTKATRVPGKKKITA